MSNVCAGIPTLSRPLTTSVVDDVCSIKSKGDGEDVPLCPVFMMEGLVEGTILGTSNGINDGNSDGKIECNALGSNVGDIVGIIDGRTEGAMLGN